MLEYSAQYGTTKYCSAYLQNKPCNNQGCMFLHETGEDNDSFSRQDLSSMNAVSTQRPTASSIASPSKSSHQPPPPQPQPPPPIISAARQPSLSRAAKDEPMSRSESDDGSALPTTASWAKNPQIQQSRRSSQAAVRSTPSPKTSYASVTPQVSDNIPLPIAEASALAETAIDDSSKGKESELTISKTSSKPPSVEEPDTRLPPIPLERAVQDVIDSTFEWSLDRSLHDEETLNLVDNYPPLIDLNGGAIRYALKLEEDRERLKQEEEERNILQAISAAEDDDNLASGSLQLGGEPEPQDNQMESVGQLGHGQRNPLQHRNYAGGNQSFDGQTNLGNEFSNLSFNGRSLTPQQQQLLLLNSNSQHEPVFEQFQKGTSGNVSQHQPSLSNPFQAQNQHLGLLSGHNRHASRYTFANDTASASATVKPATNAQVMAQQSAMMPANTAKSYTQPQQAPTMHTNFYSGVQGPPPGLKSSGTPPISGGGMFGQGHGFASAMGGAIGFGNSNVGVKNNNKDDLMRELLRGRNGVGNSLGSDTGKREFFPSFLQKPTTSTTTPAPGLLSSLYGAQLGAYNGYNDQGPSKQKKKGKKHRHANTSSSGGGGIVDLADPSILQARMHHGGIGQGPYGGTQGQGGYSSSNMMYRGGFGNGW